MLSSRGPRFLSVGTLCLLKSKSDTHTCHIFLNQIIPIKIIALPLPLRQMTAILLKLRLHSKTAPHTTKGFSVRPKWAVSQEAYTGPWCPQVMMSHRSMIPALDTSRLRELADFSIRSQKQPSSWSASSLLRNYLWHRVWKRKGQEKTLVVLVYFTFIQTLLFH